MTNRAFSVFDSRVRGQSFKPRPFGNDLLNRKKFTGVLSNAKAKRDANPSAKGKKPENGETSHGSEFNSKQLAGISQMHTKHLAAAASGDLDLDQCAKNELRERGLDPKGKWTGVKEPKDEEAKGARDYAKLRDDSGFTFDKLGADVLSAAATGKSSLNDVAKHELAYRGLDSNGTYIGTTAARAHHFPSTKLEEADAKKRKEDGKTKNRFDEMLEQAKTLKNSVGMPSSSLAGSPKPPSHYSEVAEASSKKADYGSVSDHLTAAHDHSTAAIANADSGNFEKSKEHDDQASFHRAKAAEGGNIPRQDNTMKTARIDGAYIRSKGTTGTVTWKNSLERNSYASILDSIRNRRGTGIRCALFSGDALNNHRFALPADGYIQIVPKGEHPHPSGVVQVCDDAALDAMVNEFQNNSRKPNFPGVLLDYDHMSQDSDKYSNAAGWLSDIQKRDDGLWAKANWSTSGEQAVRGGEYRFVSPVWNRSECEKIDDHRLRPMKLDTVALTNDPNIGWKRGATPITK